MNAENNEGNRDEKNVEILLVEDSPQDVELTLRALRSRNVANHVHVVKDGAEALDFLFAKGRYANRVARLAPKLVLLDLKLPKVSGLEVLKALKGNEQTKHIPVAILTSSQEEKDMVESYRLGANSYIVKPVEFDNFVEAVSVLGLYWLVVNKPLA